MKPTKLPRQSNYFGMRSSARINSDGTWLEPEELTYHSGGFKRRALALLRANKHNPIVLPYGELRIVTASIPDTWFSIPAKLKYRGRTVTGYLSTPHDAMPEDSLQFTPSADPANCVGCADGEGCKKP